MTEAWRSEREEHYTTQQGHRFIGSGGGKGEKGVAVFLHDRWADQVTRVTAISKRLLAVDVIVARRQFRFIVTYMPHGGRPDEEVASIYDAIDKLHTDAFQRHHITDIIHIIIYMYNITYIVYKCYYIYIYIHIYIYINRFVVGHTA